MQKEINELWAQLEQKGEVAKLAAQKFNKNPGTIKNHWISTEATPLEHQREFVRLLKRTLKKQQRYLNSLKA